MTDDSRYTPNQDLEAEVLKQGRVLWHSMKGAQPSFFDQKRWQARLFEWVMQDPDFKRDLFRFIDVLPTLQTSRQIAQHVQAYLLKEDRALPWPIRTVLKASTAGYSVGLPAGVIRKSAVRLARNFIAGQTPQDALSALRLLHQEGMGFSVDLLGEATVSEREADDYQARYLELINLLSDRVLHWPTDEMIDYDHLGTLCRANISLKVSALEPHLDPVDMNGSVQRLKKRVLPILLCAKERDTFVNFDLEQWAYHEITYCLFEDLLGHSHLRTWPHLGIVVQAYLKDACQDVERLVSLAKTRGVPITVRLTKGAYWDFEVARARQHGFECPVFMHKSSTDAQYEHLTEMLLQHIEHVRPAFASHNLRSLTHAAVLARQIGIPQKAYEVQMLYGMAEPERKAFRDRGCRVRVYAPVGELLPGIAYLIRRLLENTSNEGFLRLSFHEDGDSRTMLQRPQLDTRTEISARMKPGDLDTPFENCSPADFTYQQTHVAFENALAEMEAAFPLRVPVVVGGVTQVSGQTLERCCPSEPERLVAAVDLATCAQADVAVEQAVRAWPSWRDRSVDDRADLLEKLADRLQGCRFRLAALQAFEVGKPWQEADADVAEAIDFCRYYARQARSELRSRTQDHLPGEVNSIYYEGHGPTLVISPWNFPLAILCGMTTAALVAGNTVVMKPAEQSSAVGYALYEHMMEAGFPPDVVHFLPGRGEEVGWHLVEHQGIAQIAFTGSKEVGLKIMLQAAKTRPGQVQVKRVVCEMGGKNAIVIDADADLDEAVVGVVQSAFGFAGQKCSACSRVIVIEDAYEAFVRRLVEACRDLHIAPAHQPECRLGPVIDRTAFEKLQRIIDDPGPGARPLFIGQAPSGGYYVPPAIFAVEGAKHRLMQEEFFGPVLAVAKTGCFEQALRLAESTEFALTGSVYSRNPDHLEKAKRCFRVGNLYFNRSCTGALVHRQPFGGFGMSGTGTKAGGPGYLLHFADPRCVTENTVRHGFIPEL